MPWAPGSLCHYLFYCWLCPIDGAGDGGSCEDDACADARPDLFIWYIFSIDGSEDRGKL